MHYLLVSFMYCNFDNKLIISMYCLVWLSISSTGNTHFFYMMKYVCTGQRGRKTAYYSI